MPDTKIDYTEMVIKDMFEILTKHKSPWPKSYTKVQKLEFIDKMLKYLTENQEYEKCGILQQMKEDILNERVNKGKKTSRTR